VGTSLPIWPGSSIQVGTELSLLPPAFAGLARHSLNDGL
jgi:hypothetical protein